MGKLEDTYIDQQGNCVDCNLAVTKSCQLQCADCEQTFHAACKNLDKDDTQCTPTFLGLFHANSTKKPNFSWTCNTCATSKDTAHKVAMTQQIDKLSIQVSQLSDAVATIVGKVDKMNTLTPGKPPPGPTADLSTNPWSDPSAVQRIRSALVVKPHLATGGADVKKKIAKIVVENNLQVHSIGVSSTGNTFVNCPSQPVRDELQQKLREDDEMKDHVTESLHDMQPSISIVGVTTEDWASTSENTQEKIDAFTQQLKGQNGFLETMMSNGETFKILFMKPPNSNYKSYQIVARVSPAVRYAIHNKWNKLFIGATSVRVHDRFYVKRCFKCNGFGHYTAKCNGSISCGICSEENHESKDCPHNSEAAIAHHKCINCKRGGKEYENHNAASSKCPTYVLAQTKLKGNIAYYQGKNWPPTSRH